MKTYMARTSVILGQRLQNNKMYSQNSFVELPFWPQLVDPWIIPNQPVQPYYSQIVRKHFLQRLKFVFCDSNMADGEETHLPPPASFRGQLCLMRFVMKGSGFGWEGQTHWPSSLVALTVTNATINSTTEAQGHLAPGVCERQPIDVSLPPFLPPYPAL